MTLKKKKGNQTPNVRVQRRSKAKLLDVCWNAGFGHEILRSCRLKLLAKNTPKRCDRNRLLLFFGTED